MNKKVFVIAVALMAVAMLVAQVMAEPATKVAASTHLLSTKYTLTIIRDTPSGVRHIHREYTNERTLTIGTTDYDVYVVGSLDVVVNPEFGVLNIRFTAVWYVGSLTTITSDGFSGNLEQKVYTQATPQWASAHAVFQGFGSFAQYTLKLDYEGPASGMTELTGYCIIP